LPNFKETKEQEGSKGSCWDGDIAKRVPYLELNTIDKVGKQKKENRAYRQEEEVKPTKIKSV